MSRAVGWRTPLPLAAWPAADREFWERTFEARDNLFAEIQGIGRRNETTWQMMARGYGEWLRFLDHEGLLAGAADPGSQIMPATVRAYHTALRDGRRDGTIVIALDNLAAAAPIVAPGRN